MAISKIKSDQMFKYETITIAESELAANSTRTDVQTITVPSGYGYFGCEILQVANNLICSVQARNSGNDQVQMRLTFYNYNSVSVAVGGTFRIIYIES